MNRYPLWKYIMIAVILIFAAIYTAPNFFGQAPSIQVSPKRQSTKISAEMEAQIKTVLEQEKAPYTSFALDNNSLKIRFEDPSIQLKASEAIKKVINADNYIVALNAMPNAPDWLAALHARPMALGLDLRGGVHFSMQVDMKAALDKTMDRFTGDIRRILEEKNIGFDKIERQDKTLVVVLTDISKENEALKELKGRLQELTVTAREDHTLSLAVSDAYIQTMGNNAVKQNIMTLHNRINELGVTEPVIQQSGADRIVLQLPGVQDPAQAKEIIGRTATLEIHMVEEDSVLNEQAQKDLVPEGYIYVPMRVDVTDEYAGPPPRILLKKQVELTGDNINDASASYDDKNRPGISVSFDSAGARIFGKLTTENVHKRMAMVLIEQGKAEVITAPSINEPILGGRTFISGSMDSVEANNTALLLRSGSLAAPMEIIEERTIGPSLGADQIARGFHSVLWGFVVVAAFMIVYYRLFGFFSVMAMACNLLLLVAVLSLLQATLTLPGIAAIALTIGMAIDANVLINERVREELRAGNSAQASISLGYEHAWATIVDSNVTSFIAGLALLIFGSGPIRGFAVVHCIGILTSMFTSVVVFRAFVNLWYGSRRQLKTISVGQIWRPDTATQTGKD